LPPEVQNDKDKKEENKQSGILAEPISQWSKSGLTQAEYVLFLRFLFSDCFICTTIHQLLVFCACFFDKADVINHRPPAEPVV